jgi:hypothetical protein
LAAGAFFRQRLRLQGHREIFQLADALAVAVQSNEGTDE